MTNLKQGDILYVVYIGPEGWLEPEIREYTFIAMHNNYAIAQYQGKQYQLPVNTLALSKKEAIEKSIKEFEELYRKIQLVVPALKGLLSNEQ